MRDPAVRREAAASFLVGADPQDAPLRSPIEQVFDSVLHERKEPVMGVMRILDSSGDTEVLWDVSDDEALAKAASLFGELASEGKLAFERNEPQTTASRVREFNPQADEIIWVRPIQGG
jgi:hypothetical protein